jgi:phosphatidylglycerophosphate synthase
VHRVHTGPLVGLVSQLVLVGVLAATVGMATIGLLAGVACAVSTGVTLDRGMTRHRMRHLGPADKVTLVRAVLTGGVAALTADSFSRPTPVTTLVTLAAVAVVLDGVDGWVARRTRTVSVLGARFDMEVDAFLILVLSGYVAPTAGWWVLLIGAARYLFVAGGRLFPWLRGSLPPRYWCKVVAATQGVVLTVAAAGVLPRGAATAALALSLALLVESFGREAWWLWWLAVDSRREPAALAAGGVAAGVAANG